MSVGKAIASIIKEKGLKQTFVAEKSGLTRQQLNDICRERRSVSAVECFRICTVIGTDVNDLRRLCEVQ